jgi:hypothetical protein
MKGLAPGRLRIPAYFRRSGLCQATLREGN